MNARFVEAQILERADAPDNLGPVPPEGLRRRVGSKTGVTVMPSATPHIVPQLNHRWGVILAGGDGVRLKPVTRAICGDERPKQFCPLDDKSLLSRTLERVEAAIRPEQTLVTLNGQHCKWYLQEPAVRPEQRIVQPGNKGTAPAIIHALLSVDKADEDAMVGIFPADHHYSNEALFTASLEAAFTEASKHPDSVVLLGARPHYPETGYGWVELGRQVELQPDLFQVQQFQEKPSLEAAEDLLCRSSLWNTFVMVARAKGLLAILRAALPDLVDRLRTTRLWAGSETCIEYSAYQGIPATDFSTRVLPDCAEHLLVLRLGDVGWSDVGDPKRFSAVACNS